MACGSAVASLVEGRRVEELIAIRKEDVLQEVERVPEASGHAIHLALDGLMELWKAAQKLA